MSKTLTILYRAAAHLRLLFLVPAASRYFLLSSRAAFVIDRPDVEIASDVELPETRLLSHCDEIFHGIWVEKDLEPEKNNYNKIHREIREEREQVFITRNNQKYKLVNRKLLKNFIIPLSDANQEKLNAELFSTDEDYYFPKYQARMGNNRYKSQPKFWVNVEEENCELFLNAVSRLAAQNRAEQYLNRRQPVVRGAARPESGYFFAQELENQANAFFLQELQNRANALLGGKDVWWNPTWDSKLQYYKPAMVGFLSVKIETGGDTTDTSSATKKSLSTWSPSYLSSEAEVHGGGATASVHRKGENAVVNPSAGPRKGGTAMASSSSGEPASSDPAASSSKAKARFLPKVLPGTSKNQESSTSFRTSSCSATGSAVKGGLDVFFPQVSLQIDWYPYHDDAGGKSKNSPYNKNDAGNNRNKQPPVFWSEEEKRYILRGIPGGPKIGHETPDKKTAVHRGQEGCTCSSGESKNPAYDLQRPHGRFRWVKHLQFRSTEPVSEESGPPGNYASGWSASGPTPAAAKPIPAAAKAIAAAGPRSSRKKNTSGSSRLAGRSTSATRPPGTCTSGTTSHSSTSTPRSSASSSPAVSGAQGPFLAPDLSGEQASALRGLEQVLQQQEHQERQHQAVVDVVPKYFVCLHRSATGRRGCTVYFRERNFRPSAFAGCDDEREFVFCGRWRRRRRSRRLSRASRSATLGPRRRGPTRKHI
ncbi:unnamed protein product [Amoebophrya sp. A120]|nr:unnamed protein product [Amoebophrya sp. A120]|eukprot:GSA120T00004559001.1